MRRLANLLALALVSSPAWASFSLDDPAQTGVNEQLPASILQAPAPAEPKLLTPTISTDKPQNDLIVQERMESAEIATALEVKRNEQLTLHVADGQWLPDAISSYLAQLPQPMDLEWNAPSQYRLERGLAVYNDIAQLAVFNVVRNYGLSVCVWKGNVKPVLEVFPAGSEEEEKCRD